MPLDQLTILAPGLLGGSVARAARARGVAGRIVIWARSRQVQQAVAGQPWCDQVADSAEAAVKDASLVVVAAHPDAIIELFKAIAPSVKPGAIVTDVGSIKGAIARAGQATFGRRAHFVGSHPMAGSQLTGWQHGTAELFERRTCFVTPLPDTQAAAVETVSRFWTNLGAAVVKTDPDTHDRIVAHISHLPQLLASSLCAFLAGRDGAWRAHAGNGLRDTTRIAASDPKLWKTILEMNQAEVVEALKAFQLELAGLERALAKGDWDAVVATLERGKEYRDGLH
ncbi:MAG TPA: prephenate dehydrogenase/arogenate dehydrogenase family protein [Opitutaceae bacterium]|jgi:prephenate dehydrogenase|nr:prephenate dehydrogenase/arogenate dehydrogenase family protein [Opitutaceae bacterium]